MRPLSRYRGVVLGALSTLALIAVACSDPNSVVPDPRAGNPQLGVDGDLSRLVRLCKKTGPDGEYTFDVSATGGILLKGPVVTLAVGECAFVWAAASPDDPDAQVTVKEVDLPPGVSVESITYEVDTSAGIHTLTGVDEVTISASWTKAGAIYFHNQESPPPPPPGECKCEGKVTELTLRNDGPSGLIEVHQKKGDIVIFSGVVASGETFSFQGADKNGTMGTEIEIYVDGKLATKIHTSCSQPIGPGLVSGDFTVVSGSSLKGGELCPVEVTTTDESCDYCETLGKPQALTMEYTGEGCDATSNSQKPGKVECAGDPDGADPVHIHVEGKKDKVYFDGTVPLGGSFTLDAANAGESKLAADTRVTIQDESGTILQTLKFHTSCSQPLEDGDQFGSLVLTGFTPSS